MTEPTEKKRSFVGRMSSVAIGSVFAAGDVVGAGVSAAADVAKATVDRAEEIAEPVRIPLRALGVTGLVMKPVDAVTHRVESVVETLDEKGQSGLVETSGLAIESTGAFIDAVLVYVQDHPQIDALVEAQIDKVVPILEDNPAILQLVHKYVELIVPPLSRSVPIQDLIRAQAKTYIDYLSEHPEILEELIRTQGDDYIDYLNHYPAAVQSLIQGQGLGMASEIRDEVRERTVTADTAMDIIVRSVLRRPIQSEPPIPPEDVRRRAEYGRLPSDYVKEHHYGKR